MIRNLISPKSVALTLGIAIFLAAGTYGVYKYNQMIGEKEELKQQLLESKNKEIEQLKLQLEESGQENEGVVVEDEADVAGSRVEEKETQPVKEIVRTETVYVPTPVPDTSPDSSPKPSSSEEVTPEPTAEEHTRLEIFNFDTVESGDTTKATWKTNMKSDSRVIINDSFYVSNLSDSSDHSVVFTDLKKGVVVNYEIVATTDSQEVSKFGSFSTRPGELSVRFGHSKSEGCMVVVLEDEYGSAQPGVSLNISGIKISDSGRRTRSRDADKVGVTSAWGEIEYCNKVQEIKVQNTETREYYYNGKIYLF